MRNDVPWSVVIDLFVLEAGEEWEHGLPGFRPSKEHAGLDDGLFDAPLDDLLRLQWESRRRKSIYSNHLMPGR